MNDKDLLPGLREALRYAESLRDEFSIAIKTRPEDARFHRSWGESATLLRARVIPELGERIREIEEQTAREP